MERYVMECRSNGSRRHPSSTPDDHCEEGMKVPNSVLDGCQDSFTAADDKREKASTQFFKDTGIMAMLCRHDRVLFLVNMTSAGEKQHYVLALIKELFDHLPKELTVGILYDIGCFIHRSFLKHALLPDLLPRITFALSVLHAYGHQWPCQLIYHPRKCKGFGLSDGEGCERFWSQLKKLIPPLRVSGVSQLSGNCYPSKLIDFIAPPTASCSRRASQVSRREIVEWTGESFVATLESMSGVEK